MPSHRHATPSGPWPFLDVNDEIDPTMLDPNIVPRRQTHESELEYPFNTEADDWRKYPQSLFPNWSLEQQKKGGVYTLLRGGPYRRRVATSPKVRAHCYVYRLAMLKTGRFHPRSTYEPMAKVSLDNEDKFWESLIEQSTESDSEDSNLLCEMFFVDSLSGSVLQMLGTRFTIDPFFFSSSISWIPSRYTEQVVADKSDHITITLTYIVLRPSSSNLDQHDHDHDDENPLGGTPMYLRDQMAIDAQLPLLLQSCNKLLMHDMIGIHAVRHHPEHNSPSTILTYVPASPRTSALDLNARILATGRSVHWSDVYRTTRDPTILVLAELWYPLYAWDEALELLTAEVMWLESHTLTTLYVVQVPSLDNNSPDSRLGAAAQDAHTQTYNHTHQLHVLRAHLLHYSELITDFRKTVEFLAGTPHPGIPSHAIFQRECMMLLNDIARLEGTRSLLDARVGNVMDLAFSSVANEDSKRMQDLTEASLRDSAAMKQIAYITMVYLPASFSAAFFGMNIADINPGSLGAFSTYFAIAVPLTLVTIWIMMLFYRSEKKRREIEKSPPVDIAFDFTGIRLLFWSLVARLLFPIAMLSQALSFKPSAPPEPETRPPSTYASARSSVTGRRGTPRTSLRHIFTEGELATQPTASPSPISPR